MNLVNKQKCARNKARMATKIQPEALVKKILELQYNGITVHAVYFDPTFLIIATASNGTIQVDTDGRITKK